MAKNNFSLVGSQLSTLHDGSHSNCCGADGFSNTTGDLGGNILTPAVKSNKGVTGAGIGSAGAGGATVDSTKKTGQNITPDQIQMGIETASAIASAIANRQKSALQLACGHKPLFGKQKKATYQQCVSGFLASQNTPPPSVSRDSVGMSTAAKWGFGIGGTLLAVGIFIAVVKMKPKTVAVNIPAPKVA